MGQKETGVFICGFKKLKIRIFSQWVIPTYLEPLVPLRLWGEAYKRRVINKYFFILKEENTE